MQFSTNEITFNYKENDHLVFSLLIKNTLDVVQEFKVSSSQIVQSFNCQSIHNQTQFGNHLALPVITNQYCHAPISTLLLTPIVDNYENQKLQIVYGKNLKDNPQLHSFLIGLEGFPTGNENLGLSMMVESKQTRVKELEEEMKKMESMGGSSSRETVEKKGALNIKMFMFIILLGLMVGFFGPLKLFKKKIVHKKKSWW